MATASGPAPQQQTVSVAGAARFLGVHPNTVRAWSDEGRLPFYRINSRGDRRYRIADLRSALESGAGTAVRPAHIARRASRTASAPPQATRGGAGARSRAVEGSPPRPGEPAAAGGAGAGSHVQAPPSPSSARTVASETDGAAEGLSVTSTPRAAESSLAERRNVALGVVGQIARLIATRDRLDDALRAIAWLLGERLGYEGVGFYELRGESAVALGLDGEAPRAAEPWLTDMVRRAARSRQPVSGSANERAMAIPVGYGGTIWGAIVVRAAQLDTSASEELALLGTIADQVALAVDRVRLGEQVDRQLRFAQAVRRIATDIEAQVDRQVVLGELLDLARELVGADHGVLYLRGADGEYRIEAERSALAAAGPPWPDLPDCPLATRALRERGPVIALDDGDLASLIPAEAREAGVATAMIAPLLDEEGGLGFLALWHPVIYPYDPSELEMVRALVAEVGVVLKSARELARMETRAAQLQSIQQLGTRLSRFTAVREIGQAITAELGLVIDNHNVRVYQVVGDVLEPIAMRGHIGVFMDETPEQLRLRVGEGITGWVAQHGIAQMLPDAARDPRASTVPGTEADLDESMLLAPMLFEDRVLGVLVLSRLGLDQFIEDDLRLLVIYASFAAQAMANADATERLARQLRSQRELLGITDSILSSLDPSIVLEQIADRLRTLVEYDNLVVERLDVSQRVLRPLIARGPHAELFMARTRPSDSGLSGWVLQSGEGQLLPDELGDPRVHQFDEPGPVAGSLIEVPLFSPAGPIGVLMLERLGEANRFTQEEFELIRLFAAQGAIALQNAETHRAVEIRAETDPLTGLLNYGSFFSRLDQAVLRGEGFSLLMLDLDEFGRYNNALGHQAGDYLLRAIAHRLRSSVRDSDLVFRYGGDEFTALLPGTDASGAMAVARKIREAVRSVARSDLQARVGEPVTCSIGFATFPRDGADVDAVLLAADRACFVAKRGGRDRIATAAEGLALAGTIDLTTPTKVDDPGDTWQEP